MYVYVCEWVREQITLPSLQEANIRIVSEFWYLLPIESSLPGRVEILGHTNYTARHFREVTRVTMFTHCVARSAISDVVRKSRVGSIAA